jgi:multidrug transporter EmrE-like cation transporter
MKFQIDHISSLFKYTGISFTAGAVTHGFFSEERSFWTAVLGIILYLIGSTLAKLANPDERNTWTSLLFIGIFASIGLGFFTGGLQHFPDSPARSAWVVPTGFLMSLIAVYLMEGKEIASKRSIVLYALIGGVIVTVASIFAYYYYEDHHHDDHNHSSHSQPATQPVQSNDSHGHSHGGKSKHSH